MMWEVPMELFKGDPTPFLVALNDQDTLMVITSFTIHNIHYYINFPADRLELFVRGPVVGGGDGH